MISKKAITIVACIVMVFYTSGFIFLAVALARQPKFAGTTAQGSQQIMSAAYKVLEMGYGCHAEGITLSACQIKLAFQLRQHGQ